MYVPEYRIEAVGHDVGHAVVSHIIRHDLQRDPGHAARDVQRRIYPYRRIAQYKSDERYECAALMEDEPEEEKREITYYKKRERQSYDGQQRVVCRTEPVAHSDKCHYHHRGNVGTRHKLYCQSFKPSEHWFRKRCPAEQNLSFSSILKQLLLLFFRQAVVSAAAYLVKNAVGLILLLSLAGVIFLVAFPPADICVVSLAVGVLLP